MKFWWKGPAVSSWALKGYIISWAQTYHQNCVESWGTQWLCTCTQGSPRSWCRRRTGHCCAQWPSWRGEKSWGGEHTCCPVAGASCPSSKPSPRVCQQQCTATPHQCHWQPKLSCVEALQSKSHSTSAWK